MVASSTDVGSVRGGHVVRRSERRSERVRSKLRKVARKVVVGASEEKSVRPRKRVFPRGKTAERFTAAHIFPVLTRFFPMGRVAAAGDGADADESAALRAKLEDAERRLNSTALELRAALAKIHHGRANSSSPPGSPARVGRSCPCGHEGTTCAQHAGASFWRSFVLAYMVRAGVAVFSRGVGLLRSDSPRDAARFEKLLGEKHVHYREEAVRLGMFLGAFSGGYHLVRCQLCNRLGVTPERAALTAGTAAGLSAVFLKRPKRRAFAGYLAARLAQSALHSARAAREARRIEREDSQARLARLARDAKGVGSRSRSIGGNVRSAETNPKSLRGALETVVGAHGDVLLFALSSAQVMYAYVMRPETLDPGFWNFIVRAGPIDKETLGAVRAQCSGSPVDLSDLAQYAVPGKDPKAWTTGERLPCVPCAVMHRDTGCALCASHAVAASAATFRKCFPFYLSIHLVPFCVLNAAKALRNPVGTVTTATGATIRSTTFISAFVGSYMASICGLRWARGGKEHRAAYYAAGIVAGSMLFIEKKSRRGELALYLLPRAADSLVATMAVKRLVPNVPHADLLLFALVSGGLMHYFENEPETLAGFLRSGIARFTRRPNAPPPRSASESVFQVVAEETPQEDGGADDAWPRADARAACGRRAKT